MFIPKLHPRGPSAIAAAPRRRRVLVGVVAAAGNTAAPARPKPRERRRAARRCKGRPKGPASLENRRWRLGSHLASAVCKKADGEERALAASGSVTAGWFYVSKIMPLLLPFAIMSGFRPYF